ATSGSHWIGSPIAGPLAGGRTLPRLGTRWATGFVVLLLIAALIGALLVGARLLTPAPVLRHPDHLAYASNAGDLGVFIADWNGTNRVEISNPLAHPGCDNGHQPTWSPDGRYLAYRFETADACVASIAIVDATGRFVSSFPGAGWSVAWSPD